MRLNPEILDNSISELYSLGYFRILYYEIHKFSNFLLKVLSITDGMVVINNYLKKNNEMIYHVCYEINDSEEDLRRIFGKNRAICVSTPKPAILFDNRLVSFYYINDVGLIELLQK